MLKLDSSKIVIYEFWYDYAKLKNGEKTKLCYMDTYSFIAYTKSDNINKHNAKDVQSRYGASNYEWDRPFPKRRNKKEKGTKSVLKRTKYENYKMNSKESIKKNRLILKIQKVFRS